MLRSINDPACAIGCFLAEPLRSNRMQLGTSEHSFTQRVLNIHVNGVLTALFGCYMAGAT